jgi:cytoskeletal protein RodZ
MTLDTLSAETKIAAKHLLALEQNDYLALPGGVFRKGIVRAYLAAVGLTEFEAEWMERFNASLSQVAPVGEEAQRVEEEAWARFARNVKRARGSRQRPTRLRWAGVIMFFLLLALAGMMLWRWIHREALWPTAAAPAVQRFTQNGA